MKQAYWNGLPTTARTGTAVVADDPRFPRYWARTEGIVGQRIQVIEVNLDGVNHDGGVSYLDDRHGEGSAKVFGGGSPRVGHRDVAIVSGSFKATRDERDRG